MYMASAKDFRVVVYLLDGKEIKVGDGEVNQADMGAKLHEGLWLYYGNGFEFECQQDLTVLTSLLQCSSAPTEKYVTSLYEHAHHCAEDNSTAQYFDGQIAKVDFDVSKFKLEDFASQLENQLGEGLYVDVKFCLNLFTSDGQSRQLFSPGIQSENQAEIQLNYYIDRQGNKLQISIKAQDDYLSQYEGKVSERAIKRGYSDIDVSGLRSNVINDISVSVELPVQMLKEHCTTDLYAFGKEYLGFWQLAQKNVKHIWNEGAMHPVLWDGDHELLKKYNLPAYAELGPYIGGGFDGVIDEIMGIPLVCRTVYQLFTDGEQRAAMASIFTKDGLKALGKSLVNSIDETLASEYKLKHVTTKTTVTVAFAFVTLGGNSLISAGSKLDKVFGTLNDLGGLFDNCPRLAKYVKNLKLKGGAIQHQMDQLSEMAKKMGSEHIENYMQKFGDQVEVLQNAIARFRKMFDTFGSARLEKALNRIPSDKINELMAHLDGFKNLDALKRLDEDLFAKFADDLLSGGDEFVVAVKKAPELVESWKILHDAGRTILKVDPDVLTKLNKVLQNNKLNKFIPIYTVTRNIINKKELVEQIVKLQDEAAKIVGKRMSGMGDLMDDIDHFLINFVDKPGATELIRELTESGGKMAGGAFVLKTIRNNADKLGTIMKFETPVVSLVDEVGDIVVDLITDKGVLKNVFNEFKNWQRINPERYKSFTKQFVGYITNKNIGEFSYFFQKGIDGNGIKNMTELRKQVTIAFKHKTDLFENLSDEKFETLFGFSKDMKDLGDMDIQSFIDSNFDKIFKLID